MRRPSHPHPPAAGMTLIEIIISLVLFSVMGATLAVFYRPAIDSYLVSRSRAELTAEAHHAAWRMVREVQRSVPNAIRAPNTNCFETVPTYGGGRYRMARDPTQPSGATKAADGTEASTEVDVLTPLSPMPQVGDELVVANQNAGDVHTGINRREITSVTPLAASLGTVRLGFGAMAFPAGYDGGRFQLLASASSDPAVFYVCENAGVDAAGRATGRIVRVARKFQAATPTACPDTSSGDVLVTGVSACRFLYQANQGATQQSGYVSIQLELRRNQETASLLVGGHVNNNP